MTSGRSGIVKRAGRFKKAAGPVGLALVLAAAGLGLALAAAPAEAGGPGYRGHGGHGSHGHRGGSVGYRGYGRYYGSRGSFGHHGFGSRYHYGRSFGSHGYGGFPSRHHYYSSHYRGYRHYYPYKSYSLGHLHYPQPIYYYPPTYGGYVYNGAVVDPGYLPIQQPVSSPPQPIYIVVQPPAGTGYANPSGYPQESPAPTYDAPAVRPPPASTDDRPGQVFLSIEPPNAAVYLDDDLLGSGDGLAELSEPLVVSAGVHVLEVMHPDHEPQRLFFGMPAAGRLQIDFDLTGDHRGRRVRMKSLDHGLVER